MLGVSFYIELSKDNIRIITNMFDYKYKPREFKPYHTILLLFYAFFLCLHIGTIKIIFE